MAKLKPFPCCWVYHSQKQTQRAFIHRLVMGHSSNSNSDVIAVAPSQALPGKGSSSLLHVHGTLHLEHLSVLETYFPVPLQYEFLGQGPYLNCSCFSNVWPKAQLRIDAQKMCVALNPIYFHNLSRKLICAQQIHNSIVMVQGL